MTRRYFWFLVNIILLFLVCIVCINVFHLEQIYGKNKINSTNQRGNTVGNNINCGYAGQIGDWIYYASLNRVNEPYKIILCRENIKNGKKERVSNDSVRCLNLLGEWIYYGINDPAGEEPIYRMKLNGANKIKLNDDKYEFINVVGDYIYYLNVSDGFTIYRMKLDGSERRKMNNNRSWCINVVDGWIYFKSGKNVYKMSTNGGQSKLILNESIGAMILDKNWIYYFTGDKGKLCRVTITGTNKIGLTDDITDNFNIAGNNIYYGVKTDDKSYIYRIDLDGKNKTKIAEGNVGSIVGDWIYTYESYTEFMVPVRIKIDGTSKEKLYLE
jgi:hypothetical protein